VLFIEEEDAPRRVHTRLRALLRGHGHAPDDPMVLAALHRQLRISVWEGVSLDDPAMLARLEATIADFQPAVCYLDVLRKLTTKDLNKAAEASVLLGALDRLRRAHGVLFRILHHYRKQQGFRTGRGSQEMSGSFVLGAWGEQSLFFEPIGRSNGAGVRVAVQSKDGAAVPTFRLRIESEGPTHAPDLVRLLAEEETGQEEADDLVIQAIGSLPPTEAVEGKPGVSLPALMAALKRSNPTIRRALKRLLDAERILITGFTSRRAQLYGVKA
jgi:AAA domain-containing protein